MLLTRYFLIYSNETPTILSVQSSGMVHFRTIVSYLINKFHPKFHPTFTHCNRKCMSHNMNVHVPNEAFTALLVKRSIHFNIELILQN